jgi:hypothetical protein
MRYGGHGEVVHIGSPCFACHSAAAQTDFVGQTDNGCVERGLSGALITAIQSADPHCAPAP